MMKKRVASVFLAAAMLFSCVQAFAVNTVTAVPSGWSIYVNGEKTALAGYNIGGTNYYKLRDIAMAVRGTDKQFDVSWKKETNEIYMESGKEYTVLGGELTDKTAGGNKSAYPTPSPVYVDGVKTEYTAYYIQGNNYFRLRDILKTFDIGLEWSAEERTVKVDTSISYTEDGQDTNYSGAVKDQVVVVRKLDEDRRVISESLGFIISEDGKVATSYQAIRGGDIVVVSRPGESEIDIGGVIAFSESQNIAVLSTDLESQNPLKLEKTSATVGEEIKTFGYGKTSVSELSGKITEKFASNRLQGKQDYAINVRLPQNSIGAPVADADNNIIGMVCTNVYSGQQYTVFIPAAEILALNLNATPKSLETVKKETYMFARDESISGDEISMSNTIYAQIAPLRLGKDKIKIFSLRLTETDAGKRKIFINIYIDETNLDAHYFRQHSQTAEGLDEIFAQLKKINEVLYTYYPEYEYEGRIQCVTAKLIDEEKKDQLAGYELVENIEDEGSKIEFGYSCERNGWYFVAE